MDIEQLMASIEAILFVAGEAVESAHIKKVLNITDLEFDAALAELQARCEEPGRGLMLIALNDKLQLTTRPECADAIRDVLNPIQKQSLSQSVLETLAIIAYEQPVTRMRLEEVRGVKCDYAVQVLQARGLIRDMGRLEALGRPILYGTTDEFLRHFGLTSLEDLPPMQEDFGKEEEENEERDPTALQ